MRKNKIFFCFTLILVCTSIVHCDDETVTEDDVVNVDEKIEKMHEGTDDEVADREEQSIKLDGLNAQQMKEMKERAEKFAFQAEVSRMMKLIINSLYKNKEIFLRELISNASDALDKIRFLSLTDKSLLGDNEELVIRIKADLENGMIHITDTGIGMTKKHLIDYLGTIAKSETSEFLKRIANAKEEDKGGLNDLIGQFGVGFYSSFLVADKVIVASKHNDDDKQYIWESDAMEFSITEDPRGNTLGRGTTITLVLKEEAQEFLKQTKLREIVHKYSQFINFNIYLWESKTEMVEVPDEDVEEETAEKVEKEEAEKKKKEEEDEEEKKDDEEKKSDEDEDGAVEEEKEKKTKKVEKTVWDWILINESKPIWQRKPNEITDAEYNEFYKSFTKEAIEPMSHTHFIAEGEVSFKSILFIPKSGPHDLYQNYGKRKEQIKLYVRRVFITDDFEDMMPKYLSFVKGVVDSDDLPLNVSRETLQQLKLLKVIKKKLVRKVIEMIKKISIDRPAEYEDFWKEYSTSIKLGIIEDNHNRNRLVKLLRFFSSNSPTERTSLEDYVGRMKEKQTSIFYIAGTNREQLEQSPFVESLLKRGYEVLYLVDPIDEYTMQSLSDFDKKKFQNVAKEGLELQESSKAKERKEQVKKHFEPLTKWLKENGLKDKISDAQISDRLADSPCALVASRYGYSGNMERIAKSQAYQKTGTDAMGQMSKKIFEINPRHPLIKELLNRVESSSDDQSTTDLATLLFESATIRSGFDVSDAASFSSRIDRMLKLSMGISPDEKVEEDPNLIEEEEEDAAETDTVKADEDEEVEDPEDEKLTDEERDIKYDEKAEGKEEL
ncbi:hypothetical protein SNEBB_010182 [Seison nebaliae]|nr:hypothetical protein SNEBB_010182 [Seison nebaliae]